MKIPSAADSIMTSIAVPLVHHDIGFQKLLNCKSTHKVSENGGVKNNQEIVISEKIELNPSNEGVFLSGLK